MAQQQRKSTQRERLLKGMLLAANRRGYVGAHVSAVIAEAGVSRPTFYDYFDDRDDCFKACIEDVQERLLGAVTAAVSKVDAHEATGAAIRALIDYASAELAGARFLMVESTAGGTPALDARDLGIARIAAAIQQARAGAQPTEKVPDLEARTLVGSVYRMIATRLRRGEVAILRLTDDLLGWIEAYERPASGLRWQTLSPYPEPERSPHVPDVPLQRMPDVLPRGRPRISEQEIAENHRLRILYATARMTEQKGYTGATVADITRLASVDGRTFYRLFADKQEAFAAVQELGFQQIMDVTAKAFFATERWPQRTWEAGRALTQLLQENPLAAHVGFVDAYAAGHGAVQRIEDSYTAFMFFLQEGLVHGKRTEPPSRVAMEAIVAGVFEIVYLQARRREELQVAAMLPHIAHLWLTPFMGPTQADAFIDRQLKTTAAISPSSLRRKPTRRAARGDQGAPPRRR